MKMSSTNNTIDIHIYYLENIFIYMYMYFILTLHVKMLTIRPTGYIGCHYYNVLTFKGHR